MLSTIYVRLTEKHLLAQFIVSILVWQEFSSLTHGYIEQYLNSFLLQPFSSQVQSFRYSVSCSNMHHPIQLAPLWHIEHWQAVRNEYLKVMSINRCLYTVAVYSWSIANNFFIGLYCRCLEILCQIAFSSIANYFRSNLV